MHGRHVPFALSLSKEARDHSCFDRLGMNGNGEAPFEMQDPTIEYPRISSMIFGDIV